MGRTTREEVLLRLGTPNAHLEQGRFLTYAYLSLEPGRCQRVGRTRLLATGRRAFLARAVHELVLAFDEQGVLRRQALVVSE